MVDLLTAGDIIRPEDIAGIMRRTNAVEANVVNVYIATRNDSVNKFTANGTPVGSALQSGQDTHGIYANNWGDILISEVTGDDEVHVYNNTPTTPTLDFSFGPLSGDGLITLPDGVETDSSGRIYVCMTGDDFLKRYSPSGSYQARVGGSGSGNGQFGIPTDLAIASDGSIFDTDGRGGASNDRVQKFSAGLSYVLQWGSSGTGNGEFDGPWGIAVDNQDRVYVIDPGNSRVQRFSSTGTYQTQWGSGGSGNGEFANPYSIAVSRLNQVYVTDDTDRCQIFDADGTYIRQFDHGVGLEWSFVGLGPGSQTTFYRYPTSSVAAKVSAGTPDTGIAVPSDAFFTTNTIRANEIIDVRNAVESVATKYKNAVTGNAFNWTDSSSDNLYHVAVEANKYDWDRPLSSDLEAAIIRIDELNELDACLTVLEGSDVIA